MCTHLYHRNSTSQDLFPKPWKERPRSCYFSFIPLRHSRSFPGLTAACSEAHSCSQAWLSWGMSSSPWASCTVSHCWTAGTREWATESENHPNDKNKTMKETIERAHSCKDASLSITLLTKQADACSLLQHPAFRGVQPHGGHWLEEAKNGSGARFLNHRFWLKTVNRLHSICVWSSTQNAEFSWRLCFCRSHGLGM